MKKRSVISVILLSIVTCGIYGIYWMYVTTEQLRSAVPEDSRASNGTMAVVYTIITCGIYQIYWNYVIADKISKAAEKRELTIENKGIWYIILSLIGFFIVAVALIQNDINLIAERPVAE